jgi:heptosyltransferase-2
MSAVSASSSLAPPAVKRGLLLVRLHNWVGEVVLSVPSLQRLAAAGFELQLFGRSWAPALLEGCGWKVVVRSESICSAVRQLARLRRELAKQYVGVAGQALLFPKSLSSALEARLGGWRAVGFAQDGRSPLLAAAYPLPKSLHSAHVYWHLVSCFLDHFPTYPTSVTIPLTEPQMARARRILSDRGLCGRTFVVLCPFCGIANRDERKIWPGFAGLSRRLTDLGILTVVCPGPGEDARAASVLPRSIRLEGLDLGVYAAVMTQARAVVANDTGPGHLAAAVGARLVAVYGPTSTMLWAPLGNNVTLLRHPAHWVHEEAVLAAAVG